MFCPKCGRDIEWELKKVDWEKPTKYSPPETSVHCIDCDAEITIVDRSLIDQENSVEIVLH